MARRKRHGGLVGVHSEQRILNSVRTATTEGTGKVRQFLYVKGNNRIVRQDMVLN